MIVKIPRDTIPIWINTNHFVCMERDTQGYTRLHLSDGNSVQTTLLPEQVIRVFSGWND